MNKPVNASNFAGDGFGFVPRSRTLNRGNMLLFAKDIFHADGEDLTGTQLLATGITCGWRKWENGHPIDRVPGFGQPPITREQLPDQNRSIWLYRDGKPEDPWRECFRLYLTDPETGQSFTFVTDSYWGLLTIERLDEQIAVARVRTGQPYLPVVELKTEPKKKDDPGAGVRPVLKVVKWVLASDAYTSEGAAPLPAAEPATPSEGDETGGSRLADDNIPF
jgi:hypothetical protein